MLVLSERRVAWRYGKNQFCLLHITANGKRSRGRRRLAAASHQTGVERFCAGLGLILVVQNQACINFSAVLRAPFRSDLRSCQMDITEGGLLRLLSSSFHGGGPCGCC